MTKKEYAEVRDEFTGALKALGQVVNTFVDLVDFELIDNEDDVITDYDIARALDDGGRWLTGDEYREITSAIATMEKLVGRAHERAA